MLTWFFIEGVIKILRMHPWLVSNDIVQVSNTPHREFKYFPRMELLIIPRGYILQTEIPIFLSGTCESPDLQRIA